MSNSCPICESVQLTSADLSSKGCFFGCQVCEYIFKDPSQRLGLSEERNRYLAHNNDISDSRYINYLMKTFDKVRPNLKGHETVIDYGCGPTQGLKQALNKTNFKVLSFDPIFFPDTFDESIRVDAIFCSEAIEHSFLPIQVFEYWNKILGPSGIITLRTAFHPGIKNLKDWWYLDDLTHVGFFNRETFHWIAEYFKWEILQVHSPYASFRVSQS